ncbi:MAG: 1-deoxy-D-xylulose-5-phosphate reductoisomerase [Puniceicoccaceae bacterium]|nr:MAG: 1-deoxy-D-xylulose-5-phosphate reductoisomerase [Puniceicoccaceae bacterium]
MCPPLPAKEAGTSARPRRVVLLGATGSIGQSTLEVIRRHPDRLQLVGAAARSNAAELGAIAREFGVADLALYDAEAASAARANGLLPPQARLRTGADGLAELARLPGADCVVVAVVGTTALHPTLAAIDAGKSIALASKEILVLAGRFVMEAARRHGVAILPVDSEHNALFQCLQGNAPEGVKRLLLTASGGAFRDLPLEQFERITVNQALRHPNWSMGPKVTIDSATMANKGLELIEARWLFGCRPDQLGVVLHPQSIVHSMVEFIDGSMLAQLSPPSMTFALQHVLLYPERAAPARPGLDWSEALRLDFRPPDPARYPCLGLAQAALAAGGSVPAAFNAANEVAVTAFLHGRIGFTAISSIIEKTIESFPGDEPGSLAEVMEADAEARRLASGLI